MNTFRFRRLIWRLRWHHTLSTIRSHILLIMLLALCFVLDLGIRVRPPVLPTRKDLLWAGIALWPLLWWLFHLPHMR